MDIKNYFSQTLTSNKTTQIKMIGDSITQGVGGTGYLADGEAIACGFQRNNNGYCWANLFKQYIEKKYAM